MKQGKASRLYKVSKRDEVIGYYTIAQILDIVPCCKRTLQNYIDTKTDCYGYIIESTVYTTADKDRLPKIKRKDGKHCVVGSENVIKTTSSGRTYKLPIWE